MQVVKARWTQMLSTMNTVQESFIYNFYSNELTHIFPLKWLILRSTTQLAIVHLLHYKLPLRLRLLNPLIKDLVDRFLNCIPS